MRLCLKNSFFLSFACQLVWAAGLICTGILYAQTSQNDSAFRQTLDRAIRESEKVLSRYPSQIFTPNLMFQLGELYVRKAQTDFERAMLVYEAAEQQFDSGKTDELPVQPEIDLSDALRIYGGLLEKFPTAAFRDKILYRMAFTNLRQGNKEDAMLYFNKLCTETDRRELYEEAVFRMGEYLFEGNENAEAIQYYKKLLESRESPYFGMALYKLGWSYYKIDDFARAIDTFIDLIEDASVIDSAGAEMLGKTRADLQQEARDYVAICFTEYGGPDRAAEFFSNKKEEPYTEPILLELARLYRSRDFYLSAIDVLNMLIDFYSNRPAAIHYKEMIVENYELADEKPKADQIRVELVDRYGPGSPWFQSLSADHQKEALAVVEAFLYTLGTEAQARAHDSKDEFEYLLAINHYESYLARFPDHERSHKVHFYLAECHYDLGHYWDAANTYYDFLIRYPDSEFVETAAYNRILAYNHLMKAGTEVDSTGFMLTNFMGDTTFSRLLKTANSLQAQQLQASNEFVTLHPKNEHRGEVLVNYGGILFELAEFALAKQVYLAALNEPSAAGLRPHSYGMIAQCELRLNRFYESEKWLYQLIEIFPDSVAHVSKSRKLIASTRYKRAESYLADGDTLRAADAFLEVSGTAPDSGIAERALLEAAKHFEIVGNKSKSIDLLESLAVRFPRSAFIMESLFKAGRLCEDTRDWLRAANNYLKMYNLSSESRYSPECLLSAARCYENLDRPDDARTSYDIYLKKYQDDPDRFLEAAFKKGEIAYNRGDYATAQRDFELVVTKHEQFQARNGQVDNYIPANAQFLLAEILFHNFDAIQFTRPLERSVKRKRAAFENVLKAYASAAKFKVAEWATAASYKIGYTFERFADALLNGPVPENLSADAYEQYLVKLNKSVLPFKQKALEAYSANVKQAAEHGISNNWITESRKRAAALTAELSRNAPEGQGF